MVKRGRQDIEEMVTEHRSRGEQVGKDPRELKVKQEEGGFLHTRASEHVTAQRLNSTLGSKF